MNSELRGGTAVAGCPDVRYFPGFIDHDDADDCLAQLQNDSDFQQLHLTIYGRCVVSPRLIDWCGDTGISYRYSGQTHEARGWTPAAAMLRDRVTATLQQPFNFVLINFYRDGGDAMGWHADNEPSLGLRPLIASLSFGATRRFRLRRRGDHSQTAAVELEHGSLLVMSGDSQRLWQHCLPRTARPKAPRINLTFRRVIDPARYRHA